MKLQLLVYQQLWNLLHAQRLLLVGLVVIAMLTTLVEGLGVGVLLTLVRTTPLQNHFLPHNELLVTINQFIDAIPLLTRIRLAAIGLVCIAVLRGGLVYTAHLLAVMLQARVENELHHQAFQQVLDVQLAFIQRKGQSNQLEILIQYTQQIGMAVQHIALALNHFATLIIYVALLLLLAWQLTVLAFVLFVGMASLVEWSFARPLKRAMARREKLRGQVHAEFFNTLTGLQLIHLYGREKRMLTRLTEVQKTAYAAVVQAGRLIHLRAPLFSILNAFCLAILLSAATVVLPGAPEVWLGHVLLFFVIVFRLLAPAGALNQAQAQIRSYAPALQSVVDFLRRDNKPYLRNGQRQFTALHEGLTFDHVTFRYGVQEETVLQDVNFTIAQGKMTAVVGPSGAGKSTLVYLLARLADCEAGHIYVDGVDLRDLERTSWRRQLAVVSQDTFIFNDTVLANLRFVRSTATESEIVAAARLAQAHEFITALPQGYETVLGDRGVRLSGGQQQRLAIARALLVDPQLLILDEATSDLDTETEQAIQMALAEYSNRRTVFVIAHRLSTIRQANTIIVLHEGRVVEQGAHDTLMSVHGAYWRLVQAQRVGTVSPTALSANMSADCRLH